MENQAEKKAMIPRIMFKIKVDEARAAVQGVSPAEVIAFADEILVNQLDFTKDGSFYEYLGDEDPTGVSIKATIRLIKDKRFERSLAEWECYDSTDECDPSYYEVEDLLSAFEQNRRSIVPAIDVIRYVKIDGEKKSA
jgi:hypothetical protein